MWEETAWAGVVQTRLEHSHSLAKAALLTAVPFALFHMPLHFIGDFSIESLAGALVTLLIVCAIVRLMIGVFLRGTGGSILAVAVLHTLFNRSNNDEGMVGGARRRRRPQARRPDLRPGPDRRGRDRRAPRRSPDTPLTSIAELSEPTICPSHPRQGPGMNTNSNTAHHPAGAGSSHDQARQIMEAVAVAGKIPGMSVAIASPDRLLYAGAVGYADLEDRRASTVDDQYPWFSMTQDRHRHHGHAPARRRSPRHRRPHRHLPARLPGTPHARPPHDARSC